MMNRLWTTRGWMLGVCAVATAAAACSKTAPAPSDGATTAQASAQIGSNGEKYPAPRWPSYFKTPKSVDDLMPAARLLVRNQSGLQGKGMGILTPGESVLIVAADDADPMVIEAIKRALDERKITPFIQVHLRTDRASPSRPRTATASAAPAGRTSRKPASTRPPRGSPGSSPIRREPKAWLKTEAIRRRYAELFPGESADAVLTASGQKPKGEGGRRRHRRGGGGHGRLQGALRRRRCDQGLPDQAHRNARRVLGHGRQHRAAPAALSDAGQVPRHLHPPTTSTTSQSQMSTYPGDVWQLAEEQLLEPLVYVDRVEVTDPEGTNLHADITEEMAQRWAAGAYQRGHLYMFPNQATGRFGYSFVNYPAFQQKWLPREPIARIEGVLAGTQGHGGFFPRWEITFKNGFISDVKGGGAQGDGAEGVPAVSGPQRADLPVSQSAGLLVSLRDRLRLASQELPSPGRDGGHGQHQPRARAHRRHPLGPRHPPVARSGRADRIEEVARVHRRAQRRVRPRLAHADLFHDLQSAAAQRQQVGQPPRQGPHDQPRQPRGARARIALRRPELPADRGLDSGSARASTRPATT